MLPLILTLCLMLVAPRALAQAPEEPASPLLPLGVEEPDPAERLAEAVRQYQLGQSDAAKATLADLVLEEDSVPPALRQEARIYMGELLYTEGDKEGAELFFRKVLTEDPDHVLDGFRHPPDVCGFFSYVAALVDAETDSAPAVPVPVPVAVLPPPAPLSSWAPLGIYHFGHGQPLRGATYLTLQTALTGFSFVSFGLLVADHGAPAGSDDYARLLNLRTANRITGVAAFATWGVAILDAQLHWRRSTRLPQAQLGLLPAPGGGGAQARLRF